MPISHPSRISQTLRPLALAAGEAILEVYARQGKDMGVRLKADASPVTDADEAASKVILDGLASALPGVLVVCEETESAQDPSRVGASFVLVDPLDGTKEFLSRNGDFTVNIALIEDGRPVVGVVYAPARRRLFVGWTDPDGRGSAFEERVDGAPRAIHVARSEGELVVVASRSHRDASTDRYLETVRVKSFASAGSSLKFCMVASGEADLYPRLGRTMEWDTAAGQAVLEAAGGSVRALGPSFELGGPLEYGKPGFENPHFVARGG